MSCQNPMFGGADACFLQKAEQERLSVSGTEVTYYALNKGKNVDPLYNEPVPWGFEDAVDSVTFLAWFRYVEHRNKDEMATENGYEENHDAELTIAYLTWKEEAEDVFGINRPPRTGDVVEVSLGVHPSQNTLSFDVIRAGAGGVIFQSQDFTSYKLDLKKRTKFRPRRKLDAYVP